MPRPFPYPLHVGTDICSVSRIVALLTRPTGVSFGGHKFAKRLLNGWELRENAPRLSHLNELEAGAIPGSATVAETSQNAAGRKLYRKKTWKLAEFLAGRWAAKEAAIKAHPFRHLTFHDITITHEPLGRPYTGLHSFHENGVRYKKAPVAWVRAESGRNEDATEARLSISHDGEYATAVCMAAEMVPTDIQPTTAKIDPSLTTSSDSDESTASPDVSISSLIDGSKT